MQGQTKNSEKLEIFPLGVNKNLLHFTFNFEEVLKLDSLVFDTNVWPRSVFEELLKKAKIKTMRIQMANGQMNPYFYDSLIFPFEVPISGTKIYMNADVNYDHAINTLSEIFSFERKTILQQNHFLIDLPEDSQKSSRREGSLMTKFIFAHSPDDFLCVETFEKIREYVGCYGSKGIFSLIDVNKIMKSDYFSIVGYLDYNETSKNVKYRIEINTIVNYDNKEDYFQTKNMEACSIYDEAKIFSFNNKNEANSDIFDLLETKIMPFTYLPFIKLQENIRNSTGKKKMLTVEKFIAQPVYSFQNDIIYEIETKEKPIKIFIFEYLPYYFSPMLHQISGYLNFQKNETNFNIETIQSDDFVKTMLLKFTIEIPENSFYSLKIPIKKLMKSFENYPHDSARGHPLIGTPIIYYLNEKIDSTEYKIIHTPNLLMRIPEPDFSMPFNISTYTFVLLGYFYLMIFKIVMGTAYSHWSLPAKKSILSRVLYFFKKEKID